MSEYRIEIKTVAELEAALKLAEQLKTVADLTDKAGESSKEYRDNLKAVNDAAQGFKGSFFGDLKEGLLAGALKLGGEKDVENQVEKREQLKRSISEIAKESDAIEKASSEAKTKALNEEISATQKLIEERRKILLGDKIGEKAFDAGIQKIKPEAQPVAVSTGEVQGPTIPGAPTGPTTPTVAGAGSITTRSAYEIAQSDRERLAAKLELAIASGEDIKKVQELASKLETLEAVLSSESSKQIAANIAMEKANELAEKEAQASAKQTAEQEKAALAAQKQAEAEAKLAAEEKKRADAESATASFTIKSKEQLDRVRELTQAQKAYVATLKEGTPEHEAATQKLNGYNASLNSVSAGLVQELIHINAQSEGLKKAGNVTEFFVNEQRAAAIVNQLGAKSIKEVTGETDKATGSLGQIRQVLRGVSFEVPGAFRLLRLLSGWGAAAAAAGFAIKGLYDEWERLREAGEKDVWVSDFAKRMHDANRSLIDAKVSAGLFADSLARTKREAESVKPPEWQTKMDKQASDNERRANERNEKLKQLDLDRIDRWARVYPERAEQAERMRAAVEQKYEVLRVRNQQEANNTNVAIHAEAIGKQKLNVEQLQAAEAELEKKKQDNLKHSESTFGFKATNVADINAERQRVFDQLKHAGEEKQAIEHEIAVIEERINARKRRWYFGAKDSMLNTLADKSNQKADEAALAALKSSSGIAKEGIFTGVTSHPVGLEALEQMIPNLKKRLDQLTDAAPKAAIEYGKITAELAHVQSELSSSTGELAKMKKEQETLVQFVKDENKFLEEQLSLTREIEQSKARTVAMEARTKDFQTQREALEKNLASAPKDRKPFIQEEIDALEKRQNFYNKVLEAQDLYNQGMKIPVKDQETFNQRTSIGNELWAKKLELERLALQYQAQGLNRFGRLQGIIPQPLPAVDNHGIPIGPAKPKFTTVPGVPSNGPVDTSKPPVIPETEPEKPRNDHTVEDILRREKYEKWKREHSGEKPILDAPPQAQSQPEIPKINTTAINTKGDAIVESVGTLETALLANLDKIQKRIDRLADTTARRTNNTLT